MIPRTLATLVGMAAVAIGLSPLAAVEVVFAQQIKLSEEQFNQWLTNGRATPQQYFESQLNGRLERLEKTCHLSAQQREKLELAGRGDIARFESELATLHDELVGQMFDQDRFGTVYERIQPFAQRLKRGLHDEDSLFEKVAVKSLAPEQRAAFLRAEAERRRFQYEAKVKLLVAMVDGMAPMLDEQREALLALLLKTTRPPKRWESQYEWMYALHQASTAPRDDVGKILDAAQLRCFENMVAQAARYGTTLKRAGMVPEDDESSPAAERDADEAPVQFDFVVPEIQIGG